MLITVNIDTQVIHYLFYLESLRTKNSSDFVSFFLFTKYDQFQLFICSIQWQHVQLISVLCL